MRSSISIALAFVALVLSAGGALARIGTTTTDLGLRAGPSSNTELLLTIPGGAKVNVGSCSGSWCRVSFSGYSGYAVRSGLVISTASGPRVAVRALYPPPGEIVPIYPPYPYRSGYYPKADWYFDIPPYTAIEPSFYRRRYFMMAQERNRYRFVPHIFHGYGYGEGGPITHIDMQKVSASLKSDEATTTRPTAPYTPPAVTIPPLTTPPAVTTPPATMTPSPSVPPGQ
jgi:uncharacterized protein YraI